MAMQLSKQQQQYVGAGAVLFLVFIGVYVKFFWLPIAHAKAEATAKIAEIEAKIAKAKQQAARLERLQAEIASLNERAAEAEKRLPKTKSVPDILLSISALAQKHRVSIMSFAPGPQKSQTYFIELAYPLSIKGSYHNIGRFLAALSLEERIFNVRNISYPSADATGDMTVTFTLLSYQYKG
ncbi:MAG: type 4a pilus biogenesis protein PilO [Elusimicrobiota bacterium]|nr:type 4a pilus biogenesis protein PilO [Elusimicrobiota bacterium]